MTYKEQLDWVWQNCKVVYWRTAPFTYPIEHDAKLNKHGREEIEAYIKLEDEFMSLTDIAPKPSEDNRLIRSEAELSDFFFRAFRSQASPVQIERGKAGVMVDSSIRKEVLVGASEGKVTINGRILKYHFEDMKGGVWKVTLPHLKD